MAPLRRRRQEVKAEAIDLARRRDEANTTRTRNNRESDLINLLMDFAHEISQVQVLDAACGSANFLYIALKLLGKPVELLRFAGQKHWILERDKRALWSKSIIAWFDRWLKDQPEWWNDLYPPPERDDTRDGAGGAG